MLIGFSGSRNVSPNELRRAVLEVRPSDKVVVGCAKGVDEYVRTTFSHAKVFKVSSYGKRKGAYARRSMAMVQYIRNNHGVLWAFPSRDCPVGLKVSKNAFSGFGSGTWATCSYAIALGVKTRIYWYCCPWGLSPKDDYLLFTPNVQLSLF